MSDQVIIKHKWNHRQLNETKINIQEQEVNRIRIDYIKPGHKRVQLLIIYIIMQFQQYQHIRFTLRASLSCLTDHILSYYYIFQPPLHAYNEDPRSLFIEILGGAQPQGLFHK